jgi:rhodanese-related sulfurtransferase
MKSCLVVVVLALVLVASAVSWADETSWLLVDVRSREEYDGGHLQGAVHIDRSDIRSKIGYYAAPYDQRIYLYCDTGQRSRIAANILRNMGYRNARNVGCYDDLLRREQARQGY